jgi:hypothetical protein
MMSEGRVEFLGSGMPLSNNLSLLKYSVHAYKSHEQINASRLYSEYDRCATLKLEFHLKRCVRTSQKRFIH